MFLGFFKLVWEIRASSHAKPSDQGHRRWPWVVGCRKCSPLTPSLRVGVYSRGMGPTWPSGKGDVGAKATLSLSAELSPSWSWEVFLMIGDTCEVEPEPILGAPCPRQLVLLPEQNLQCAMARQGSCPEITPGVKNRTGTYLLFKLWCGIPPRAFFSPQSGV